MNYWWVNHKQTYQHEIGGGYIWSPKIKKGGARNQSYDNLRFVVPGDLVFSYAFAQIRQVGVVTRPAASCLRPTEFGHAGAAWGEDGWMVPVEWHNVPEPLRPKEFIAALRPHLPVKHSPLNPQTGAGYQHIYLTAVPEDLADVLFDRIGNWSAELQRLAEGTGDDDGAVRAVDDVLEARVRADVTLDATIRQAVVAARRGQGRFRFNVEAVEQGCRVTGVTNPRLLRASHIKPWRSCDTSNERLDGDNGLLLCPNVDHLFDRGYISFKDDGNVLISPRIDPAEVERLGVATSSPLNVGLFRSGQAAYLRFHRDNVFLDNR